MVEETAPKEKLRTNCDGFVTVANAVDVEEEDAERREEEGRAALRRSGVLDRARKSEAMAIVSGWMDGRADKNAGQSHEQREELPGRPCPKRHQFSA